MDLESARSSEQELLAEQLTDAEVRLVLERLNAEEFEVPDGATVGAVVEATGASPVVIARIVGAMRKTAFEERFNETFLVHEERLDDLEENADCIDHRVRRVEDRLMPSALTRGQPEDRSVETIAGIILLFLLLAGGFGIAGVVAENSANAGGGYRVDTAPALAHSYTNVAGDKVTIDDRFEVTIHRKDGSYRPPTGAEKAEARGFLNSIKRNGR